MEEFAKIDRQTIELKGPASATALGISSSSISISLFSVT